LLFSADHLLASLTRLLSRSSINLKTAVAIACIWLACTLAITGIRKYVIEFHKESIVIFHGADVRDGLFRLSEPETASDPDKWRLNHSPDADWHTVANFRRFVRHIQFIPAFGQFPSVMTFLGGLVIPPGENVRLMVSVKNVEKDGCEIVISTWNASKIDSIRVHWLAYQTSPN
jgi:hypothetical protein